MDLSTSVTVSKRIHHWHEWVIQDFNTCILKSFTSSRFIVKEYGEIEWYLQFNERKDNSGWVGYSLYLSVSETKSFEIHLQLGIIDSKKNFLHLYQSKSSLQGTNGIQAFISQYQLHEQRKKYAPGNTLRIGCEITLIGPAASSSTISIDIPPGQLSDDFSQLLDDEATADITLTVGNKNFNAHKAILMTRSSVFAAMLQNPMQESIEKKIEIEDLKAETVGKVLQFIYTDKVDGLENDTLDLLHAADKYDLKRLKAMCESSLYNHINIENAAELLVVADSYQAHQLKTLVRYFIKSHRKEIRVTESFKETKRTRPELILEMTELNES